MDSSKFVVWVKELRAPFFTASVRRWRIVRQGFLI